MYWTVPTIVRSVVSGVVIVGGDVITDERPVPITACALARPKSSRRASVVP
jgi:hypothetical protein